MSAQRKGRGDIRINSLGELADLIGAAHTANSVERRVYKDTECGAWCLVDVEGVSLGSIVEGSHAAVGPTCLVYPFSAKDWDEAVQHVEDEVKRIWNETHGCCDCGLRGAVNPECKSCDGEGVVI